MRSSHLGCRIRCSGLCVFHFPLGVWLPRNGAEARLLADYHPS